MPHLNPAIWWITIENCDGEPVNEFGVGMPGHGDVSLAEAQILARNNLTCSGGRAIITAAICAVDVDGVTDLPTPPLDGPRFPDASAT